MQTRNRPSFTRRGFAHAIGATMLFSPSLASSQTVGPVRRNVSSFQTHNWQEARKIGRRSSNGCIGLYNEHIDEVFEHGQFGTKVKLI